jgi:hypothetical protein
MNEKKEYGYIQFPLCLLMETYKEDTESGLRLILRYGIMNYAKKLNYSLNDVANQVAYSFSRKYNILEDSIKHKINKAITSLQFSVVGDAEWYIRTNDLHENNLSELLNMFEEDEEFKNDSIRHYQIHLATSQDHLNLSISSYDSLISSYNIALQMQKDFESKFGSDAMPSCKISMLFSFIKNSKDIDILRSYLGIKSMIGMRNFISTNKPSILSRMVGCKSKAAFEYYTTDRYKKNRVLLPTVEKYKKRYHMDKLLMSLAERKYIMFLSKEKVSVIYMSTYMEPEELGKLIKDTKAKLNLKKRMKVVTDSL